jgi:hypothetical protein
MRSCLIQILVALAVVFLLVWFALPLAVSALAAGALNAAGFNGTDTHVEVSANPPPLLLTGHADTVHITASDASLSDLHAAGVDVTLGSVDLMSRSIGTVNGTLTGVRVAAPNGDTVSIDKVTLSGPADRTVATCSLSLAQAQALAESQLAAQGIKATVRFVAPNVVKLLVSGKTFDGRLVATDGSLFLVPDSKSMPTVLLINPGSGNPFRVTSAVVDDSHVTLTGSIDIDSLLN